jgi:hypothetical protein
VITTRYLKQANYDAAADILIRGATALLRAGSQQGTSASGGDLAVMLVVEVYNKAGWEISNDDDDGVEARTRKSQLNILLLSQLAVRMAEPACSGACMSGCWEEKQQVSLLRISRSLR